MKLSRKSTAEPLLAHKRQASFAILLAMLLPLTGLPMLVQAEPLSVLTGAYNEEQATVGQSLYYQHCLNCHGETLGGVDKAPPLTGPQFGSTWNNAPLEALVARILTMPPDKPGKLSREESVQILSYLLWYNGLPLGNSPLVADSAVLAQVLFQLPSTGE